MVWRLCHLLFRFRSIVVNCHLLLCLCISSTQHRCMNILYSRRYMLTHQPEKTSIAAVKAVIMISLLAADINSSSFHFTDYGQPFWFFRHFIDYGQFCPNSNDAEWHPEASYRKSCVGKVFWYVDNHGCV